MQVEVDLIEFDYTPGAGLPDRLSAKLTTLTIREAEDLLLPQVIGGTAKLLRRHKATLHPGEIACLTTAELKTNAENDPFKDPDSEVTVSVGGVPQKFTTRNVGAELNLLLVSASPEPIKIDATLQQTCFEGFVEYGGTQINVTRTDGKPTKVTVPSGFYQPVFSSASREEKLSLRTGETVVLRVDWTDCKTGEDYSTRPIPAPEGFQSKYAQPSKTSKPMLILLRLRSDP